MPNFSAVVELSGLDGTNGFELRGAAAGDFSGLEGIIDLAAGDFVL